MKLISKSYFLAIVGSCLMLQGIPLAAHEHLNARLTHIQECQKFNGQDEKDSEPLDIRTISEDEYVTLQEIRLESAPETSDGKEVEERAAKDGDPQKAKGLLAKAFWTSHAGAWHSPFAMIGLGDFIVFEDQSQWAIRTSDTYKVLNWIPSDIVVVTPNLNPYSFYRFHITNQNTFVTVDANFLVHAKPPFAFKVASIDKFNYKLFLTDGSYWDITDPNFFNSWLPNDYITIGINTDEFSSAYPNILINFNTKTYIRAFCYP